MHRIGWKKLKNRRIGCCFKPVWNLDLKLYTLYCWVRRANEYGSQGMVGTTKEKGFTKPGVSVKSGKQGNSFRKIDKLEAENAL